MEEDIKILEEVKRPILATGFERQTKILQALKNLIKGYREKEESEKYLYDAYQDAGKKMFEYAEELEKIKNDSIPKSKIRKIIKNWKNQSNYYGSNIIQDLQKILKEEV